LKWQRIVFGLKQCHKRVVFGGRDSVVEVTSIGGEAEEFFIVLEGGKSSHEVVAALDWTVEWCSGTFRETIPCLGL